MTWSRAAADPTRCRGNPDRARNRLATSAIRRSKHSGPARPRSRFDLCLRRWQRVRTALDVAHFSVVVFDPVCGAYRGQLPAYQVEFGTQPVQHPVHLAGLVATQCLTELDGLDVG